MRTTSSAILLVTGMLAGVILVLSCSDNSPGNADAASCECPAAELPIAGRIMVVDQTRTLPPDSRGGQDAECPPGALRLTGSCTTADVSQIRDVTLKEAGFREATNLRSWSCEFRNNEATEVTIKATVVCLLPGS